MMPHTTDNLDFVAEWAAGEKLVSKAYIYGSRARGDHKEVSDLDVAVELIPEPGDQNVLATWLFEKSSLVSRLQAKSPFKVQLELLNGDETPKVLSGVDADGILVYEKGT